MAVEERLSGTLVALADGGTLIVGEPAAPPQPRQGLFRQRPKPPPTRYVQYLRSDRYLACECVGASSFGGDIPLTVEQDDAIRTLGWRLPSDGSDAEPPRRTRTITGPCRWTRRVRPRVSGSVRWPRSGCARKT